MDFRSAGFTGRPLLRAVSYDDRIGTINRDLTLSLESEFQAPLKRGLRPKGSPAKGQQKTDFAHQRERVCRNPQALLFAHVRKGRKKPVDCPRPRYLRSAAKNDLSIWVKPQPCMVKMRACGVPHALIFTYASQKRLPKI